MLIRHCGKVCECVVRRLYTTPCFRLLLACAPLNSMDTAFDNTRHLWLITLKGVLSCAKNYFWDDNCKKKKGSFISNLWFLNCCPLSLIIMRCRLGWRKGRRLWIYSCKNEQSRRMFAQEILGNNKPEKVRLSQVLVPLDRRASQWKSCPFPVIFPAGSKWEKHWEFYKNT